MAREGVTRIGDRTVAYLEVGDLSGPLVLHNHGGPGSRIEARLFESAAQSCGLHLVAVDRPGIGKSDPQQGRTFKTWSDDLVALADHFEAERFAVTGWSEGGPWALAAAAYLDPARLVHVTNIAGGCYGTFGPNWAAKYLSSQDALGGRLALHFHPGFTLMYELLGMTAKHFRARYGRAIQKAVSAPDREVLADKEVMELFLAESHECFAQGAEGLVVDATLLYEAWPFDVGTITRPVHFWQGAADELVPEGINKTVAQGTPGAIWHSVSDGGHFIAVSHAAEILSVAADDLQPPR